MFAPNIPSSIRLKRSLLRDFPSKFFLRKELASRLVLDNTAIPQMFAPPRTGRLGAIVRRARATLSVFARHGLFSRAPAVRVPATGQHGRRFCGFTLLELLIVVAIIGLLLVLMAPAFTTIKGGTDVTSAAYTIKGVLDTARTYAKANNTYTWVGFSGSIGSNVTGGVALSMVASKDGTDLGTSVNQTPGNRVDITTLVTPVGKVIRLDNAHIGDTGTPQPSSSPAPEFETRASVNVNYRLGAPGSQYNSDYYFIEQGTQFDRWIRFSPRGEVVVKGGDTQITQYAEVGLLPTHGTTLAATINPASGNLVAIQISGLGGNVKIYRR
jgi:prepilin-type N-terminal cleavage/methylation domain-containing protein